MTAAQIGSAGEAAVAAAFLRLGVPVYLPVGDAGVDLLADFGGRPQRVQVKTCAGRTPTLHFHMECRRLGGRATYPEGMVDWFALYAMAYDRVLLMRASDQRVRTVQTVQFAETRQAVGADTVQADIYDICAVLAQYIEEDEHGKEDSDTDHRSECAQDVD